MLLGCYRRKDILAELDNMHNHVILILWEMGFGKWGKWEMGLGWLWGFGGFGGFGIGNARK
jgi:hypothetical protein